MPAPGAFTVKVTPEGGQTRRRGLGGGGKGGGGGEKGGPDAVTVAGAQVTLALESAVAPGDAVTVSYRVPRGPAAAPLRDTAANPAAGLVDEAVANETPAPDTEAPELVEATVEGAALVLAWGEALDERSVPGASAFTVTVTPAGGAAAVRALADTAPVAVEGAQVTLTLAEAVAPGDAVTLGYAVPEGAGAAPLRDAAGNPAPAVAAREVANRTAPPALTAALLELPAAHGGATFSFELRFSESPEMTYKALRGVDGVPAAMTVTGGRITKTPRIDTSSNRRWRVEVDPHGESDVTIALAATADCAAEGAICTLDGRPLAQGVEAEVPAFEPPQSTGLAAELIDLPEVHVGQAFTFELRFSEEVEVSYRTLRTDDDAEPSAFEVTGGAITGAARLAKPSNRRWRITVLPEAASDVTIALRATEDCEAPAAICTAGGDPLAAGVEATVTDARPDETAPALDEATVDGAALTLTFDEALDEGAVPAPEAFTVTVTPEGGAAAVRALADTGAVAVEGETVTLTLAAAVRHGDAVTLDYAVPEGAGAAPIRDAAQNPAAAVTDWEVANRTPDATAPALDEATVDGAALVLVFDEALDEGAVPGAAAFTVTVTPAGGAAAVRALADTAPVAVEGAHVTLALAAAVAPGDAVTLDYAVPSGAGAAPLRDLAGNPAAALAGEPVGNATPDRTAPALDEATVDGAALVLAFDEALDEASVPGAAAFTVTVTPEGGEAGMRALAATGAVAVRGAAVTLTLAAAVRHDDAVTVGYAVPSGAGAAPIRDLAGNAAAALAGEPVGNATPDVIAPVLDEATVDGAALVLAFDEALDEASVPGAEAFTVEVTPEGGEAETRALAETGAVTVRGAAVTLTLASEVADDDAVTVGYAVPEGAGAAPLRDAAGNAAAALGARAVRNVTGITARFEALPEGHGGAPFDFELAFSRAPSVSYVTLRDHAFDVAGGEVTRAERIEKGSSLRWRIRVEPQGQAPVSITLPATADCAAEGAICTANGRALSAAVAAEVPAEAPEEPAGPALTGELVALPERHGGAPFAFELAFSEAPDVSAAALRDHAFAVTGGAVTGVRALEPGGTRRWEITVRPEGQGAVSIALGATTDCAAEGAICTANGRALSAALAAEVPGEGARDVPFTVRFANVDSEHDGRTAALLEVHFSEEPRGLSYTTLRDETLVARQGQTAFTPSARRIGVTRMVEGSSRSWEVSVRPRSKADLVLSITPVSDCAAAGAVCNGDGEPLASAVTATIVGPPALSVADARATEAPGARVDFAVTMGRASASTVTVDYATADGTATAGSDYTATSGTLSFAPGETAKTVSVRVLDDAHDEGEETFTLTLSNPSGGNAWLADATATGTIENSDAMPQAWLARFGRTVAEQAIEAVEGRFAAGRAPGIEMTLAGERIGAGGAAPDDEEARAKQIEEQEARAGLAAMTEWLSGAETRDGEARPAGERSRGVTPRELLTGSSFALTGEAASGGTVSLWGRGAVSRFDGIEGDLALDGEVVSAMLGADWSGGPGSGAGVRDGRASPGSGAGAWTAGLLVSHSIGEGGYRGPEAGGTVESTLTAVFPYGRYALNGRVSVWGIAGYGAGELTLTPKNPGTGAGDAAMRTDMDLAMAAVGLRGVAVQAGPEGGLELAVKTDAMAVRTTSEKVEGLAAAEADVTRLRLGLEGSWRGLTLGSGALVPNIEVGLRHDGGDAETGFGLDLGGGLAWSDPASGLAAELRGRGLLTHASRGFRNRGFAGTFGWQPDRGAGRGPSLTLTQSIGGAASGGMESLLGQRHLGGLAANDRWTGSGADGDDLENRRLELRMGYGFSVAGDRFTLAPEAGLGLANGHREYTLGWRLGMVGGGTNAFEIGFEATRSEPTGANDDLEPQHGVRLRATARW